MSVRPIIFSASMVRALLAGRKTQTRRVLNDAEAHEPYVADGIVLWEHPDGPVYRWERIPALGDLLWVREAFAKVGDEPDDVHACPDLRVQAYYRADRVDPERQKWRSPIHMPRWASRLTLRVTDVRVQRVQDITLGDCWAEGCKTGRDLIGAHAIPKGAALPFKEFRELWGSIHAKARGTANGWKANPWVCALTFDVIRANVDETDT